MADNSLNQEDKLINDSGKTLGEVINNLPVVRYLRETFPEKMTNFNFLPSVKAILENQNFRRNSSYDATTMLTQEEIDFITREGIEQIEERISEDVTNTHVGIVLVKGKLDEKASLKQQEDLGLEAKDVGNYFVEIKKEETKRETIKEALYYGSAEEFFESIQAIDKKLDDNMKKILSGKELIDYDGYSKFKNDFENYLKEEKEEEAKAKDSDKDTNDTVSNEDSPKESEKELSIELTKDILDGLKPVDPSIVSLKNATAQTYDTLGYSTKIKGYLHLYDIDNLSEEECKLLLSFNRLRNISKEEYDRVSETEGLYAVTDMPYQTADYIENVEKAFLFKKMKEVYKRIAETGNDALSIDEVTMIVHALKYGNEDSMQLGNLATNIAEQLGLKVEKDMPTKMIMTFVYTRYGDLFNSKHGKERSCFKNIRKGKRKNENH